MSIVNNLKVLDSVTSQYVTADFGIADLNKVSEVNIASPAEGQVLKYDSTTGKWVNGAATGGTITSIATGAGLTGGPVTESGTIKANLKSETESALTAASKGSTADREYAVGLDANGKLSVNIPWTDSTPVTSVNGNTGTVSLNAGDVGAIASSLKGEASGVAELDENGKVPTSQLPSYVDDVLEYTAISDFPATGEVGKIYIATSTNLTYRWGGSEYVEISPTIALGETSATAYRGDRGKTAYDHATDSNKLTTAQSSGLYKIATTAEGHIASATAVIKSDITGLGIPGSDTNTLSELTDTTISSTPSDGDMLRYNSTSGKWENTSQVVLPVNPSTQPTTPGAIWIDIP